MLMDDPYNGGHYQPAAPRANAIAPAATWQPSNEGDVDAQRAAADFKGLRLQLIGWLSGLADSNPSSVKALAAVARARAAHTPSDIEPRNLTDDGEVRTNASGLDSLSEAEAIANGRIPSQVVNGRRVAR